jgi:hypothetical protein
MKVTNLGRYQKIDRQSILPGQLKKRALDMEAQSIVTIITPFLVFGALLVVLLLAWDR